MPRTIPAVIVLVVVASLISCATTQRLAAASDVRRLLVAIRDDDHEAFDTHVDRAALRATIQARFVRGAKSANVNQGFRSLGVLLSGPLSRAAGGLLIQPEVFRAVADYYGYRPDTPIPNVLALAAVLTSLPGGKVCATGRKGGPCLLTFADEGGAWRLVDFDADSPMLRPATRRP